MWRLIIIASVAVLASAKPELYKETEDFQYSRSSSDDGTKSGFYGARRGNMGGNYERAHNMDGLAQHQMSSAVRQVEGELGEGAKTKTGSVYTAANSRGIFGSGNYDLSNLKGRNFEESESFGSDSLSHSSLTSQNTGYRGHSYSSAQNAGYSSGFTKNSRHNSGYHSADYLGQYAHNENAREQDAYQGNSQYSYGKHEASGRDYKYYSHGGSQSQNQYDYNKSNLQNSYDSNVYTRVTDAPVVIMRPGTIVTIPIASKAVDSSSYKDLSYNRNSVNSEVETMLDGNNQQIYVKPANTPKHYESSYSYRKEWERRNSQPVTVMPTENPFPKNSELYDDSHLLQNAKNQYSTLDESNVHASSANLAHSDTYSANVKSSSQSKSRYHSASQAQGLSAAALSNAYTLDTHNAQQTADANNLVEDISSKPKSYHSSYSYHKSWERRGDPYVIKPVGGEAQRLVAASGNQGAYSSHHYGSQYKQAHQSYTQDGIDCDCDENGQIRVARSADPKPYFDDQEQQQFEAFNDLGQQVQNKWENLEDLGQQTQDLGQLQQNKWDNLEDLGQQTQNQWDRLENLGQETQNQWTNQQEDLGQQTQNTFDNLQELGQQTQNKWENLENLGQQTQDQFDIHQNIGQETQNNWNRLESFNQQIPIGDLSQQTQDDKFENFHEQAPNEDNVTPKQTINQYVSGHNSYMNNNFQDSLNHFDITQNNDQKQIISNNEDEQIEQKNQFWNIFQENKKYSDQDKMVREQSQDFPYNYNFNTENKDNNIFLHKNNEQDMHFQQNHYHDTHVINNRDHDTSQTASVLSLWDKLDRIESSYKSHANEDYQKQEQNSYSNTQTSYQSWDKFKWDHSHSANDDAIFDSIKPKHEQSTTTSRISSQNPTSTTTTSAPKYNSPHKIVPQGPIDIGRGDIGADETLVDSVEKSEVDNVPVYRPSKPDMPYKTPQEIESLSLINERPNDQTDLLKNQVSEGVRESGNKNREEHNQVNNLQGNILLTTDKNNKFLSTDDFQNMNKNYNQEMASFHTQETVSNQQSDEKTHFDDKQKLVGNNDLEVAPFDIEQQNMEQQFEDFSQNLQSPLLFDNFEQSDVQQLESFGKLNIDDNQDTQEQIQGQEFEPFMGDNQLQSQSRLNLERSGPSGDNPKEGRNLHMETNKHAALSEEPQISQRIEPQLAEGGKDTIVPPPVEVITEKPSFWKSVGNKFTNAKETVVSWFKS